MINILVPIAGHAQRFINAGIRTPKPMIMVNGKRMLDLSMSCLDIPNARLIFVVRKEHKELISFIANKWPFCTIIRTSEVTPGMLHTCLLACDEINTSDELYIYSPDVIFKPKFSGVNTDVDGCLLTFKANSSAHSYVQTNDDGFVNLVAEKRVISNDANVGVYYFKSGRIFIKAAQKYLKNHKGESNISPVYNELISMGHKNIIQSKVEEMHVLGTPEDLDIYYKLYRKPQKIVLCADHSGFSTKNMMHHVLCKFNYDVIDVGCYNSHPSDQHDYLSQAIDLVQNNHADFIMSFCQTGQAMSLQSNKAIGIRSALIYNVKAAKMAIQHNGVNAFAIPSFFPDKYDLTEIVNCLEKYNFMGGRHQSRILKFQNDNRFIV